MEKVPGSNPGLVTFITFNIMCKLDHCQVLIVCSNGLLVSFRRHWRQAVQQETGNQTMHIVLGDFDNIGGNGEGADMAALSVLEVVMVVARQNAKSQVPMTIQIYPLTSPESRLA